MEKKTLSIETVSVKIKVLTVNNKRLTLSVFKQIREAPFFDAEFQRQGILLGYVKKDGYWIIWIKNEELRKTEINRIEFEKPEYLIGLLRIFDKIGSRSSSEFGFRDYGIPRSSQKIYTKIPEAEIDLELDKAAHFVKSYNDFYDSILRGNNQLYISI